MFDSFVWTSKFLIETVLTDKVGELEEHAKERFFLIFHSKNAYQYKVP